MEEFHSHVAKFRIHVRIVDDFAYQEDLLRGELGARFVGVLNGAVHTVAEPKFVGELEGEIAGHERMPAPANQVHNPTVVISGESAFDDALEPEAAAEV